MSGGKGYVLTGSVIKHAAQRPVISEIPVCKQLHIVTFVGSCGKLCTLITVDDPGGAIAGNSPLECVYHPPGLHAEGNVPAYEKAAVHMQNGHRRHKCTRHGNIPELDRPHLISADHADTPPAARTVTQ